MFKNERAVRFVVMVTPEDLKGILLKCFDSILVEHTTIDLDGWLIL